MIVQERTIPAALRRRTELSGNHIAIVFDNVLYTWNEVDQITDLAADMLHELGVKKGTHVGIMGLNTIEWVISYLAVMKLGAIGVLINHSYQEEELIYALKYADVEVFIAGICKKQIDAKEIAERRKEDLPMLRLCMNMEKSVDGLILSVKDRSIEINGKEMKKYHPTQENVVHEDDDAMIIFTSGTTSRPKGVVQSHGAVVRAMGSVANRMRWTDQDRIVMPLPLFHGSGINCGLMVTILSGMSMVLQRSFHSVEVMEAIQEYRCTVFNAVPSMMLLMIRNPHFEEYELGTLRSGLLSGSTITDESYSKICGALHAEHLLPAYGMTETTTLNTIAEYDSTFEERVGSAGTILEDMELRIWDPEKQTEQDTGKIGEIQLRGYCITKGYYNMAERTEEAMLPCGWFKTGDAGYLDEKGALHFVSRYSQMIIRGGENISPLEIEQCIEEFDESIAAVKVLGVSDPIMQEEPVALIQLQSGNLDKEKLVEYMKSKLACFKVPRYIFVVDDFAMTSSGKIDMKEAQKIALERIKEETNEQ